MLFKESLGPNQYALPPGATQKAGTWNILDSTCMDVVFSYDRWSGGLPQSSTPGPGSDGWYPQKGGPCPDNGGDWHYDPSSCLYRGSVRESKPIMMWYGTQLNKNHAISFRATTTTTTTAARPPAHDLNCFWNGTGDLSAEKYYLTIGGLCGWFIGASGIEYMSAPKRHNGYVAGSLLNIEVKTYYQVFAGHFEGVDFLFINDRLVQAVLMPFVSRELDGFSPQVAIGTYGYDCAQTAIYLSEVNVFNITKKSVASLPVVPTGP